MMDAPSFPPKINRYEIKRVLQEGGMGVVYLAYDPTIEREVVIKMLAQARLADKTERIRFFREARLAAAIEDEAIVPVYDFFELDQVPYIVMRYMPGGSLADLLRFGYLPLGRACRIIDRIAGPLDRLHELGIIHRDLKPGNILFDQHGSAYLADFGIAKSTGRANRSPMARLTGDPLGTLPYMSPEQIEQDASLDGRADVYSLGVILFEMLSGRLPYTADNAFQLARLHLEAPIPNLLEIQPNLPGDVQRIIERALAKRAADRYPLAGALAGELDEAARSAGTGSAARTGPLPVRPPGNVGTREAAEPGAKPPAGPVVVCAVCGLTLADPSKPCPECGSLRRFTLAPRGK